MKEIEERELARLEKIARAATPGPWERLSVDREGRKRSWVQDELGRTLVIVSGIDFKRRFNDCAYIAAFSPDVVLALLAEVMEYRSKKDDLK